MLASFLTTILFSLSAISGRRLSLHLHGTKANLLRLSLGALLLGAWSHVFGFGVGGFGMGGSGIVICAGCKYSPHPWVRSAERPLRRCDGSCAARTGTLVREMASGNEHGTL
jgi:hypothetical protein